MIYNQFGKAKKSISRISFGAMRLPKHGENVDTEKSAEIIRRAFELGINYFDTAPYYCNSQSESTLGKALKCVRKDVMIATKLPWEHIETGKEAREWLEKSLRELDTDYIDIYQLWSLKYEGLINFCIPKGIITELLKAKEEGLIKHLGFSFHSNPNDITDILESTDVFDTMLVLSNIYDRSRDEQIMLASKTKIDIINMGALCTCGPLEPEYREIANANGFNPYFTALKYVMQNPAFCSVLSSFNSVERVEKTVEFIKGNISVSDKENSIINNIKQL